MPTGIIRNTRVAKNRDGENQVRILEVEIDDGDDVQTCEFVIAGGIDYHPPIGAKVFLTGEGNAWKIVIGVDDEVVPTVGVGEYKTYSVDTSDPPVIKGFVHLKSDGEIEIDAAGGANVTIEPGGDVVLNSGSGTAVEFARLKTAFDQLKSDHDSLVSSYNTHKHVTTATVDSGPLGLIAATTSTGSPTTADIDPAESNTIRIP